MAAGMNGHLAKPVATRELHAMLAQWLEPAPAATRPASGAPMSPPEQPAGPQPGFDPAAGLDRLGGNAALQRRLIDDFRQHLQRDLSALPSALQRLRADSPAEAFAALQQQMHSLKGVAGNLCLPRLARLARALDQQLKLGNVPDAPLQQAFAQALGQTASELDAWRQRQAATESSVPPAARRPAGQAAPQLQCAALEQLLDAVQRSEFIDEARLEQLGLQLPDDLQPLWQRIVRALDSFDFPQAALLVEQVLSALRARNRPPC